MQMNHHILAKLTTDAILQRFKSGAWKCTPGGSERIYRVNTPARFPSPDAAFYDEGVGIITSFEFKPPTESKRGILTGVGQSIAYLRHSQASYLIAPKTLADFQLGDYLTDMFQHQVSPHLPVGLILYDNDTPSQVTAACTIRPDTLTASCAFSQQHRVNERFWAKHQDLPLGLFHLLLHCYFLKQTHAISETPFQYCWAHHLIAPDVLTSLRAVDVLDCKNNIITTLGTNKPLHFLEKTLTKVKNGTYSRAKFATTIDINASGDTLFNSYKKNYISFLKNIQVVDEESALTESGFQLYRLGLIHGPNSLMFKKYFTKEILFEGHHLDLLYDLNDILVEFPNQPANSCVKYMEKAYEEKGLIKRNPARQVNSTSRVSFLKYERILWKALGLITENSGKMRVNWKLITEICALPDL